MATAETLSATSLIELRPSQIPAAILAERQTGRSIMLWGPPGVAKSALSKQVATGIRDDLGSGIAFIDVRLSQMDPTDLRGIPHMSEVGGETGVRWSTPFIMPKDLDLSLVAEVLAMEETEVRFSNPKGANDIYYVRAPKIEVRSLTKGARARIVIRPDVEDADPVISVDEVDGRPARAFITEKDAPGALRDRFTVALVDINGDYVSGKVRVKIKGKAHGILGLEEFNSAPPSVQAAAYQLVLDRRLGEYIVPSGVYVMAMGNRETDRGVTFKMPTPVRNRYVHLVAISDFADWQQWAVGARVHEEVIGFLSNFDNYLFAFDPTSDLNAFPTPRTWEFVSDQLHAEADVTPEIERALICGKVGDAVGAQFVEFRKIAASMPDPEEILQGRLTKMPESEAIEGQQMDRKKADISIAYALTTIMCYRLKDRADAIRRDHPRDWKSTKTYADWCVQADNYLAFMMNNFKAEICVMGAKAAISIHRLPFDTQKQKLFDVFAERFRGMMLSREPA